MRYLAIDLGDRRTGLALGDSVTRLASPAGVLRIRRDAADGRTLLDAIVAEAARLLGEGPRSPGEIVLGLPLNMDGSEGPPAKAARAFAALLGERTGRTVHLHDERLTSAEADWRMARSGLTHAQKKARRDAVAAATILESFLANLPGAADDPPPRE